MAVSTTDLLEAVETSLFLLPNVPGAVTNLGIDGLLGRITPLSHPLVNMVGAASLTPENADATIRQVLDLYARQDKAFGWLTGPSTTPADLEARLASAGLTKIETLAGMVLTDLAIEIPVTPEIEIREATPEEVRRLSDVTARSYDLPLEVAELLNEAVLQARDRLVTRIYHAYLAGGEHPVGFGFLIHIPQSSIALLGGAATLPEHRGRGAYKNFVAKRLADARAGGAEAAVIQAVRSTSAPICSRLGFEEICDLALYAWMPARGHA